MENYEICSNIVNAKILREKSNRIFDAENNITIEKMTFVCNFIMNKCNKLAEMGYRDYILSRRNIFELCSDTIVMTNEAIDRILEIITNKFEESGYTIETIKDDVCGGGYWIVIKW